jgi:putative peptidoglycan lipid II flippase
MVAAFTMISRVAGLVRDTVIFHIFGATRITDAFFIAFTIPNIMRRFVAEGALTISFIPIYSEVRQKEGPERARAFLATTLGALLIVLLLLVALGIVFAPAFVFALASGFSDEPETFALTVELTRWLFPYVAFVSLVGLSMGVLNAHRHFAAPAAAPIFLNISMVLAALLIAPHLEEPIFALVGGVLLGGAIQLVLQLPPLWGRRLVVRPRISFADPAMRELGRLLLPQLFGAAVYQINIVVLRQLASLLPEGHISYYYNADRLMQLALGVFAIAIATAALPTMSDQAARKDHRGLLESWRFSLTLTNFITVPAALGLFAVAMPIVSTLYLHGRFDWSDVQLTAHTAMAFAPGLIGIAATRTTVQVFFALKDTRTPVVVGAATMAINLGLGLALLRYQVVGLAASFSIASLIQAALLIAWLRLRVGALAEEKIAMGMGRILLAGGIQAAFALVACGAAFFVAGQGDWQAGPTAINIALLAASLLSAVAIYAGLSLATKRPEATMVMQTFARRLRR